MLKGKFYLIHHIYCSDIPPCAYSLFLSLSKFLHNNLPILTLNKSYLKESHAILKLNVKNVNYFSRNLINPRLSHNEWLWKRRNRTLINWYFVFGPGRLQYFFPCNCVCVCVENRERGGDSATGVRSGSPGKASLDYGPISTLFANGERNRRPDPISWVQLRHRAQLSVCSTRQSYICERNCPKF